MPQPSDGSLVEGPEDPEPREKSEQSTLNKDLKGRVVQVPRPLLNRQRQGKLAVLPLNATRARAQPRVLAPHDEAGLPHLYPLLDAGVVDVHSLTQAVA